MKALLIKYTISGSYNMSYFSLSGAVAVLGFSQAFKEINDSEDEEGDGTANRDCDVPLVCHFEWYER